MNTELLQSIKQALHSLMPNKVTLPLSGEVVSVEDLTCTVKIVGDLEIPDVRLRATTATATEEFLIVPKVGSKCLIWSVTGELDDLVLLKADQIEKINIKSNGLEFVFDASSQKVRIANNQVSLSELFELLADTLTNFKVLTPNGPSTGLDPLTIASIMEFQTKFNLLLN